MTDQRQRLIIGLVDQTYAPSRDRIVSTACLARSPLNALVNSNIEFPHYDSEYGAEVARNMALAALYKMVPVLNDQHNVSYSLQYWHMLVLPWIMQTASLVVRRWQEIEAAVTQWGHIPLTVDVTREMPSFELGGHKDFMSFVLYDDHFNFWLRSMFVVMLKPQNWQIVELDGVSYANKTNHTQTSLENCDLIPKRVRIHRSNGMGRIQWLIVEAAARLLPTKVKKSVERQDKNVFNNSGVPECVRTIFNTMLDAFRPDYIVDKFKALNNIADKMKYAPGKVFIPSIMKLNFVDLDTFVIANARERGEVIVSHQHGGGYGYDRHFYSVSEVEYSLDGFLSWGWKRHEGYLANAVPVSSPRLSAVQKRNTAQMNFVYLEGGTPLRDTRYTSAHEARHLFLNLKNKVSFFDHLSKFSFEQCIYKPRLESQTEAWALRNKDEYGLVFKKYKTIRTSNLDIDTLLSQSHMVITDYMGTPLAEALAANIPVIAFWSEEQWPLVDEAKYYFDLLVDAKIVHLCPIKAADHLNAVSLNVNDWWSSNEVQQARLAWCKQFGLRRKFWCMDWLRALVHVKLN